MQEQITKRKLAERVKELSCLYAVARVAQANEHSLPTLFREVVKVIPQGWQFPGQAMVQLRLDDQEYGTPVHTKNAMCSSFRVEQQERGEICVAYPKAGNPGQDSLFLPEEHQLLDKIAADLSAVVERHERIERQSLLDSRMRSNDRLTILAEITAGIAHELNTPLGNVLGYAELLKKEETAPDRRSDLQRIIDSALIGREIVKKLMYFSCEMPAQFQLADVNKALRSVLHLLEQRLGQQHVSVQWQLAPSLPPVRMDQVQFAQVISNIVLNAAAAMPEGGTITLATEHGAGIVSITVTDTGAGIAEADLKKIFQPFFTTKPIGEGTGLGLAVVHGIMKGHGGSVVATSTLGMGTTFTLSFPIPSP